MRWRRPPPPSRGLFQGHPGSCSSPAGLCRTTFPMVPCGSGDINVLFQNCLHTDTFFPRSLSLRRPLPGCRDRAATAGVPRPVAASPLEALPAAVHFLVGWMEPGGSARGGGAAGQSPPGAWGISWRAGGCGKRPRLSLQRRLLSASQAGPAAVTMLRGW